MKKSIVLLISVALCLTMFVSIALAAATVTVSAPVYNSSTGAVTISGTATSADVTIGIQKGSEPAVYLDYNVTATGGSYSKTFSGKTLSGVYTVTVVNNIDDATETTTFDTTVASSSSAASSSKTSSTTSFASSSKTSSTSSAINGSSNISGSNNAIGTTSTSSKSPNSGTNGNILITLLVGFVSLSACAIIYFIRRNRTIDNNN